MCTTSTCTYHVHVRALLTGMCVARPLCRHYHYYFLSPDHTLPCTRGQNIRPHPHTRPPPQHRDHYHDHALHPYLTQQPTKPIIGEKEIVEGE